MARRPPRKGNKTKAEARRRKAARERARACPRLGHETMLQLVPMQSAVEALQRRLEVPAGEAPKLVAEHDVTSSDDVGELIRRYVAIGEQVQGWGEEDCMLEASLLCVHIMCATNFELGGRKAFWVSAELAEQLGHTNLDVSGEALQLPFAACTFCFNDSATLALVSDAAKGSTSNPHFGMLSVYVSLVPEDQVGNGLRFVFMADRFDGQWPYLISRDVITDGARTLEEILDSHPAESHDPFFRTPQLKALVKLVVNAVLYSTSADLKTETLDPPQQRGPESIARPLTGQTVFHLPGRVLIDPSSKGPGPSDQKSDSPTSHKILKRFWVRGHWRRPPASWKDQRLRWIRPHLKGPDAAVVIERQYQLGRSESPNTRRNPP